MSLKKRLIPALVGATLATLVVNEDVTVNADITA